MQQVFLGNSKWIRYFESDGAKEAYLVAHGSIEKGLFTENNCNAMIHFYQFHGHNTYNTTIGHALNYTPNIRLSDGTLVQGCAKKIATSIMGGGQACWNYNLIGWDKDQSGRFVQDWQSGVGTKNKADLLMLEPRNKFLEMVWVPNTSNMNELFPLINPLKYDIIHFLCCRAVKTDDNDYNSSFQENTTPTMTDSYKLSNPYWPALM